MRPRRPAQYSSETDQAYWITVPGETIGFLHVFELDDPTPMFDLRIAADHRGRGHGTAAVRWLTGMVFDGFPDATRIEGSTRQDNIAMRRTFAAAGYQKEARYREAWPGRDGRVYDTVGYAMLRRDWRDGTITPVRWDDGY